MIGAMAPAAAVDDITDEAPGDPVEETEETPSDPASAVIVQLNIQVNQQVDVDPDACQVSVQANEQNADVSIEGDVGAVVVVQENVQVTTQIIATTDAATTEQCQETIQVNQQTADANTEGDIDASLSQASTQIVDQQMISV